MLEDLISKAKLWTEQISVLIITIITPQFIIYPELVKIAPIFAEGSTRVGRGPGSLAEVALMATLFIGAFPYNFPRLLIEN